MRTILVGFVFVLSVGLYAQNKYTPMNVKTGLWEVTRTATTNGEAPFLAGMLSNLSPEQRAQMEARMSKNARTNSDTQTYRSCLTREQLQQGPAFDKETKECSRSLVSSTSSSAELQFTCDMEGVQANGTAQVQAFSPEQVKGSTKATATGNGHTMNTSSTFTAKWIGPDCGGTQ